MRVKAVQETLSFQNPPHLFLNTHPAELEKPLIESMKSLRAMNQSQRLTLEIHEKAITDTASMKRLREARPHWISAWPSTIWPGKRGSWS